MNNNILFYSANIQFNKNVSREGGASDGHVERTPGMAALTYWVVGPLRSYTQEGWVDNIRTCSVRCLEIACVQEHEN